MGLPGMDFLVRERRTFNKKVQLLVEQLQFFDKNELICLSLMSLMFVFLDSRLPVA